VKRLTLAIALWGIGLPAAAQQAPDEGEPTDASLPPELDVTADEEAAPDDGDDEGAPDDGDAIFVEPHDQLDAPRPTGPPSAPEGYSLRRTPRRANGLVHVDVLSIGERELTLHAHTLDELQEMTAQCTAPCVLELPRGRYRFEIDPRGGDPFDADGGAHYVSGDRMALQMSYDHRIGLRTMGWTFFGLSATALGLSAIGGIFGVLIFGLPIAAVLFIPALPLIFVRDSARVELAPLPLQ